MENAIERATIGNLSSALHLANLGRNLDNKLEDIDKLIHTFEVLNAPADATHYHILGLEANATQAEIRKKYRFFSLNLHPDKNSFPGATEAFKRIGIHYLKR